MDTSDVRSTMQELESLDLQKASTVGQLVDAMSRCSFGARMLGECARKIFEWIQEKRKPVVIYDGDDLGLIKLLSVDWRKKNYISSIDNSQSYSTGQCKIFQTDNVIFVGGYSERWESLLREKVKSAIFVNQFGQAFEGQVRDGFFPQVVFCDPRFVMPIIDIALDEWMGNSAISIGEAFEKLSRYGGLAEEVRHAVDVLFNSVNDSETTVFMTVSGAMTVAKMGLLICDMIDSGMVHYVASTGALMTHGLIEGIGLKHYKYNPKHSDATLAEQKLNRITDTLEPEENFDEIERVIQYVLSEFDGNRAISSSEFHREIGRYLAMNSAGRGILKSAFIKGVPVCSPAFTDSEIGNDIYTENMRRKIAGRKPIVVDLEKDTELLIRMATGAKRRAIFSIGGGVPRNNTQNVAPLVEILNERLGLNLNPCPFYYGCRIDPTPMFYGNLSGCTYSEGGSWRKFDLDGQMAEVHADATIVWPFILKRVIQKMA